MRRPLTPERLVLLLAAPLLAVALLLATTSDGQDVPALRAAGASAGLPAPARLQIGPAQVVPATTASGRRRGRVRVAVPVALRDPAAEGRIPDGAFELRFDGRVAHPDPRASAAPGAFDLLSPLPAGGTRAGELRFELGGDDTAALRRAPRLVLHIALPGLPPSSHELRVRGPAG